jgi:hypothetical protein
LACSPSISSSPRISRCNVNEGDLNRVWMCALLPTWLLHVADSVRHHPERAIACSQLKLRGVELLQGLESPDQYSTEATFEVCTLVHIRLLPLQIPRRMKGASAVRCCISQLPGDNGFHVICRLLVVNWTAFRASKKHWAAMKSPARLFINDNALHLMHTQH